ncbi:MAG: alpha/beta fold hydrolase [Deltaproteobacteria bacterium]|nr:alpha/beta fold hydrolase [Deltaproteobacteria bacterium]
MKILKWIFLSIGAVVAAACLYLLAVAILPGFEVPEQPLDKTKQQLQMPHEDTPVSRGEVSFKVKGTEVRAWLYIPQEVSERLPCIVMASGLGGTREMGEGYALRFQKAGFAVLAFDYRYFGQSGGEPRQLIWIPHQLEDWAGAIEYVRSHPGMDPARIALWGTSLSGGHVIVTAAKDHKIACIAAQCPGVDGHTSAELAFETLPLGYNLRMLMHGQRDLVRSWLGLSPHRVPIVGRPGSIALMTRSHAYEAFAALAPQGFINAACARIIIRGDKYRPIKYAHEVRCPVLLQICEKDQLVSLKSIEETGRILGQRADIRRYPIGHFDVYFGKNYETSVQDQIAFFKKHL